MVVNSELQVDRHTKIVVDEGKLTIIGDGPTVELHLAAWQWEELLQMVVHEALQAVWREFTAYREERHESAAKGVPG